MSGVTRPEDVWARLNGHAAGRAHAMVASPVYASEIRPAFATEPSYLDATVPYDVVRASEARFDPRNWRDPVLDPVRNAHDALAGDWSRATSVRATGPVVTLVWHDAQSDENGVTFAVTGSGTHEFSWYKSRGSVSSYHHDGSPGTLGEYVDLMCLLDGAHMLDGLLHDWG